MGPLLSLVLIFGLSASLPRAAWPQADSSLVIPGDAQAPATPTAPPAAPTGSNGVIRGVVLDQEDHQPLPNARVGIYRVLPADSEWTMVKGALTGPDGSFHFEVPPATYRAIFNYQSYSVLVRDDLQVHPGATIDLTVTLTPKPLQIKGVDVKGQERQSSEATSLAKQKKAEYVTDAITSEQIAKSTDSNAAEALQRVTGLSVVGGRYVYVRGLGERYSSTQVNGASVGTPEPNKKVVPLDVFPSGSLDNIVVQKTYTPDQEGEFAGGVIDLNTRDRVEGKSLSQNISMGYSASVMDRKFLTYKGGSIDFLGFDDGTRGYPGFFQSLAGQRRVVQRGVFGGDGFSREEVQALGRSFNKTWSPERTGGKPNYSYSGSYGSGFHVLGKEVGVLAALTLSNSFTTVDRDNNAYSGTSTRLTPLYLYRVAESKANVLGGAITNLSLRLAQSHSIQFRGLYTRSTEDNARVMQGPNFNFGTDLVRISSLDYIQRGLFLGVLSGTHGFPSLGDLQADWRASYSEAARGEPDRRESIYESNGRGGVAVSGRASLPFTRTFGDMNEYDRSGAANLARSLHLWEGRDLKLKIGGAYRSKNRLSSFRRLGFRLGTLGKSQLDLTLPPESLLVDENIKPGFFELQEETRENDTYRASQQIRAGYGMATIPVLARLELLAGARFESSSQFVEAKSPFVTTVDPVDVSLKDEDLLPALNATYRLSDRMNARAGYSVTVSRPELREMSPFDIYDYETGYSEIGNTEIKSTRIQNYDARWEFFPGTRELVALSGFRKVLFQPIENVVEGSSGGYILSPRNGRDGRLSGIEVETRVGVKSIWDAFDRLLPIPNSPSALDRWAINFNYSRVSSSVRVRTTTDAAGNPVFRKGPLQGQSSYALNAGIYYGATAIQGSIMLSRFGQRLAQVGAGAFPSSLPDIYEHPPTSLDMTMTKGLGSMLNLRLTAENLLNDATEFRQLGLITRRFNSGRSYSLSLNIKG